ncbi:ABC transporter substrate-binding protein [Jatrophihabitans sp.]|uniref:ABC transporter substrate-binding protein n=1 Tax=Jatrophihabitans sp. TaxID=1932789 RepID=UPI002EF8E644
MSPKVALGAVSLLSAAVVLAGCGGGNDNKGSGTTSGNAGKGPITFVTGKDNSGLMPHLAEAWNAKHPDEKVTVKQQSDQADQQLSDLQQHFQAKDPGYDVVTVDVVWTAEFAAKGWLTPLTGKNAMDTSSLLGPTVKAATYNGTLYAAPYASDAGLLYYRKDLVPKAPTTWDEMIAACQGKTSPTITGPKPACYAGQFAKYEGLTVNASEAINSAGGQIVKEDGKTPNLETAEAAKGLEFLVNGFKQGYIPKEALGFQETQSLNAFQAGQLLFMRNWPYADAILAGTGSKVAGKFDIAPLPGPNGPGASSLGGHSVALSAYSKNQGTGLEFLKFIQSPEIQSYNLTQGSQAPVIASLYDDQALIKKFPYLPVLKKGIENAIPRPVTPFYPAVTEAIETNAYAALQGTTSVESALKSLQAAIQSATAG